MSRLLCCGWICVSSLLFLVDAQQSPAPKPGVLHSTLMSICNKEPVRGAIGCSMYRLCTNQTLNPPIWSSLCGTWRIASSLCSDDVNIVESTGGFCKGYDRNECDASAIKA